MSTAIRLNGSSITGNGLPSGEAFWHLTPALQCSLCSCASLANKSVVVGSVVGSSRHSCLLCSEEKQIVLVLVSRLRLWLSLLRPKDKHLICYHLVYLARVYVLPIPVRWLVEPSTSNINFGTSHPNSVDAGRVLETAAWTITLNFLWKP